METEGNILDHITLKSTYHELMNEGLVQLAGKIQAILNNNELPKPDNHNKKDDKTTSFYKVILSTEEIETIQDLLLTKEAEYVSENGETTELASFYSSLADSWGNIIS